MREKHKREKTTRKRRRRKAERESERERGRESEREIIYIIFFLDFMHFIFLCIPENQSQVTHSEPKVNIYRSTNLNTNSSTNEVKL